MSVQSIELYRDGVTRFGWRIKWRSGVTRSDVAIHSHSPPHIPSPKSHAPTTKCSGALLYDELVSNRDILSLEVGP